MKKSLLILSMILTTITVFAARPAETDAHSYKTAFKSLTAVVEEFKNKEGFDVMSLGPVAISAVRTLSRMTADASQDDDTKMAVAFLSGVKKMVVAEYGESAEDIRNAFNERVESAMDKIEPIMEANDEEDNVKIYGTVDEDTKKVTDLVIFVRDDCLVCIQGNISLEDVSKMVDE